MTQISLKSVIICSLFALCMACSNTSNQPDMSLIPVRLDKKLGYIDQEGVYVINPQFDRAEPFMGGLAEVVSPDGKTGFINRKGEYEIEAQFKDATFFSDGLAFVVSEGGYPTCIDRSGETKFELKQARKVWRFSDGLALFTADKSRHGFVNTSGEVVINSQFDNAHSFSEGLAAVEQNGKWGFIDKKGSIVINPQFERVSDFSEGKAAFSNGKSWGYINKKGIYVINPQFDEAGDFSEGMAAIKLNGKYGYIDNDGKIEINPQFDDAIGFQSDLALVEQDDQWGYINPKGVYVINPQFKNVTPFYGNIALVESNDQWGIIDREGKYTVNPQFDIAFGYYSTILDYDYILSDYYDATAFFNKFFAKANGLNKFDGFTATSTLQDVLNNTLYNNVEATNRNEKIAYTDRDQKITDEINVTETQFYFANPIYKNVTSYSTYSGHSFATGTRKQYKLSEKLGGIVYHLSFSGSARDKINSITGALKTEIEKRYSVKMEEPEKGTYSTLQTDGLYFLIFHSENSCAVAVLFDRKVLQ